MNDITYTQRDGSFLHGFGSRSFKRCLSRTRADIERQIGEFYNKASRLSRIEHEVKDLLHIAARKDRADRMEAFVTYLLAVLYEEGDVMEYGWHKMYTDSIKIDSLGVDQWCRLAECHGGMFCLIDSKSTDGAVERQRKGWRGGVVMPFKPDGDPEGIMSRVEVLPIAKKLLSDMIAFFDPGSGRRDNTS